MMHNPLSAGSFPADNGLFRGSEFMKQLLKIMDRILEIATIVCFVAMIAVVMVQIYARFFMNQAPSWTEEIARVLFIGAIAFASPLGMKYKQFVRVDLLVNKLKGAPLLVSELIINISITAFLWMVSYVSVGFIKLGLMQRASTLDFPMAIPFAGITVATFFIGLYSLLQVYEDIKLFKKGSASK
jgi:TRAP-type transport system small permease protein